MKYYPINNINYIIDKHWSLLRVCFPLVSTSIPHTFASKILSIKIHPLIQFNCYTTIKPLYVYNPTSIPIDDIDYVTTYKAYYKYNNLKFYLDQFPFQYKKHSKLQPMNFNKFLMHANITAMAFSMLLYDAIDNVKKGKYTLCQEFY